MINLLPPKQKEEFAEERKIKIFLILGFLILFCSILFGVLLFSIKIYLTAEIREQDFLLKSASYSMDNPKYKELENKISESNKLISQLNNFYGKEINIIKIFENISNIIPSGVTLTNFSYQKDTNQIILQGKSATRDSLLIFKKALESQKEVKNLSSPVSNLLKSSDIDFYFSFKLSK